MKRLIDANTLRAEFTGNFNDGYYTVAEIKAIIDTAPTVDTVPVVHGQWQWLSSTYDRVPCEMRYMCDKCHHETITHGHEPWEKYCPNCGAKMDLEGR